MEIHHHHSSHEHKKWHHYFWEFFMLFLAVFCGFIAENFREHFVDHQKEKQFMRSLVEDLATDTTELKRAILICDSVALYSDSTLSFLSSYKISDKVPVRFSFLIGIAGQNQTLINTDRTSSQLKNSGGMRLIEKKIVSDAILNYWKQIEKTNITLERYRNYRDAGRDLIFKLWVMPTVYTRNGSQDSVNVQMLRVIDTDHKKWDELANLISISGLISKRVHLTNLIKQSKLAAELIVLIKKEYHLE
ncbi:MAG TPA: hypothetical protein VHD35_08150 [Chitinophagaceae bacterium]|nr:hypothetical protein [Chitinophagaceae bacterium]